MYDIVICIIHHSKVDLTLQCISSISEPRLKIKICLIDNNPEERINDIIAKRFSNIDIIINPVAKGFGANQNMIMKKYEGKYQSFMSLNNDTFLMKNSIFYLYKFLFKNKTTGAVCPLMVDKENNSQATFGPIPNATTHIFRILNLKKILSIKIVRNYLYKHINFLPKFLQEYLNAKNGYNTTKEIPRISGACVLFKKQAIHIVGNYDERFYMYSEDSDWSIRARNKNLKFFLVETAKIIHHVGASGSIKTKLELEKSMFLYIEKHQLRFKKLIIIIIAFILALIHIFNYFLCIFTLKSSKRKKLHKQLIYLGLYKLFKPI